MRMAAASRQASQPWSWMPFAGCDRLPSSYVASQGTALQRAGRVHVSKVGQEVWVGGDTRTTVGGNVAL